MVISTYKPDLGKLPSYNFIENFDGDEGRLFLKCIGDFICKIGDKFYYECGASKHKVTLPLSNGAINNGALERGEEAKERAYENMWK